jgi:endonuclease YncB( thermonuclease family)
VLIGALGVGYYGSELVPVVLGVPTVVATANPSSLVGRASVIDGDTIEIRGERIRLNGIDAPESAQTCLDGKGKEYRCGTKAAAALEQLLKASSPTRCDFVERDRYGRFVGDCYRADGSSVQAPFVRSGWALDWPRYSGGKFSREQEAARRERLGIWAGEFQVPWEWRTEQRLEYQQPTKMAPLILSRQSGECQIKGNISSSGERIYHLPGQENYAKTKITESKGERWFCSEADARAAGWRRAQR